jgi:hypothetical protein
MREVNEKFDELVERAEEYGASWASRICQKAREAGIEAPRRWAGTLEQARVVVDSFARRIGFFDRERLAVIVQRAAKREWNEAMATQRLFGAETVEAEPELLASSGGMRQRR